MTNIEDFDTLRDLYPYGTNSHNYVYNLLTSEGWTQRFYETNSNVDDTDFATQGGNLDNADLHNHFGQGDWSGGTAYIQ